MPGHPSLDNGPDGAEFLTHEVPQSDDELYRTEFDLAGVPTDIPYVRVTLQARNAAGLGPSSHMGEFRKDRQFVGPDTLLMVRWRKRRKVGGIAGRIAIDGKPAVESPVLRAAAAWASTRREVPVEAEGFARAGVERQRLRPVAKSARAAEL